MHRDSSSAPTGQSMVPGGARAGERQARHAHSLGTASHELLGELDGLNEIVIGIEME